MSDHEYSDFLDETPYPRVTEHPLSVYPGWLRIAEQDEAAPPDTFRTCRVLLTGPFHDGVSRRFNIVVALFRKPPREWPPTHAGSTTAGINLTDDEVRALRDACDEYLTAGGETI